MSRILNALKQLEQQTPEHLQGSPPGDGVELSPTPAEEREGGAGAEASHVVGAAFPQATLAAEVDQASASSESRAAQQPFTIWPGQPTPEHARAFQKLADAILDRLAGQLPATLVFFSPTDRTGTTGMLVPLAGALAWKVPQGVLAVDANFRAPALADALKAKQPQGLAEVFEAAISWQEAVQETEIEGLYLLAGAKGRDSRAGPPAHWNAGPLLPQLARRWPLVLVDSASLRYPEANTLLHWCTAACLVTRLHHTSPTAIQEAVELVQRSGAWLLGSVLLGC